MKEDVLNINGNKITGIWEEDGDYYDQLENMEYVTTHTFSKKLDTPISEEALKKLDKLIEDSLNKRLIKLNDEDLVDMYEEIDEDGEGEEYERASIDYDGLKIKNNTLILKFHSGCYIY